MYARMAIGTDTAERELHDRKPVLELADGTRLVPAEEIEPARLSGDPNHAFTLADVQREEAEPFRGYRRLAS